MQLSEKQIPFAAFLLHFWNLQLSFKYFEKRNDPHSLRIYDIIDSERRRKVLFLKTLAE